MDENRSDTEERPSDDPGLPMGIKRADLRLLMLHTGISLLLIFGVAVMIGIHYRPEIHSLGAAFVKNFAGWGLFLCFFTMDAFMLPIPQDPFSVLAYEGGMSFSHVVLWAGTGSVVGGVLAYWMGSVVGRTEWFEQRFGKHRESGEFFMEKWGVWAVVVAGLTPFPYSVFCWLGGVLRMNVWVFLIGSLATRYIRVAIYLSIINGGLGL